MPYYIVFKTICKCKNEIPIIFPLFFVEKGQEKIDVCGIGRVISGRIVIKVFLTFGDDLAGIFIDYMLYQKGEGISFRSISYQIGFGYRKHFYIVKPMMIMGSGGWPGR